METLRAHRYAIAIVLLLGALTATLKFAVIGTTPNSDYASYVASAKLIAGQTQPIYPQRLLKPLAPALVAVFSPIVGFPAAFLFEVICFYFAFALALYFLCYEFFADRRLAVLGALLGALSYPILRYGVDLYTETGAQFFYLLSLILTLAYLKAPSKKLLISNALAVGTGFLWKEYSVVAGLVFALALLFEQIAWRERVRNLAVFTLIALIPTALTQLWIFFAYHYTYLDWYRAGGASGFATQFTLRNLVKSIAGLLGLAWLLAPLGAARIMSLTRVQKRFLAMAIPPSLLCLAWGYVSSRLFYVMAPAFILLALAGIERFPRSLAYALVMLAILANLGWLYFATL